MGGGQNPPSHEAVESGNTSTFAGADGSVSIENSELLQALIHGLGGPHAVIEQLSVVLEQEAQAGVDATAGDVGEDTPGYCYLRLFDRVEHRDAREMGAYPSVAELRRFSNRRANPFGLRQVEVLINAGSGERAAHVRYHGGTAGLRPVSALAALAKDCRVGGTDSTEGEDKSVLVKLGLFLDIRDASVMTGGSKWFEQAILGGHAFVPNDLPFNVPDAERYPYARYAGLEALSKSMTYTDGWDFCVSLGARREETPPDGFWTQSFATSLMLAAYFKLTASNREKFVRAVVWIREPIPGRPGGVQIVPPEWPHAIPTPVHHIMTRYAGLADWVSKLPKPWPEVCRMSLFGIHEPFDPIWWADYHKTVDVYILYSRLSSDLRRSFSENVYWIPDGTADGVGYGSVGNSLTSGAGGGEGLAIVEDGYCYLRLFRPSRRIAMRALLGKNPWASAVVAVLSNQPGVWSRGRFQLKISPKVTGGATSFHQGHIEEQDGGLSVSALLNLLSGTVRLGASNDLNALLEVQQEHIAVKPTVFPTHPIGGGPGMELSFNMFALLGKDPVKYPSITFDILREPAFAMLLGSFESIQLVSAVFYMEVSTGAQNAIWAAITSPGAEMNTESDWLSTHLNVIVNGSDQGYVRASMRLPDVHPFERELRALSSVGNPPPSFRFSFQGAVGGTGNVKGQFVVRVRGQYPLGHIRVGAPKTGKAYRQNLKHIVSTFPAMTIGETRPPRRGEDDEDDDEEESNEDEPVRRTPPKVNASVVRANGRA